MYTRGSRGIVRCKLGGGRLHDTDKIRGAYQSADGGREYKMAQTLARNASGPILIYLFL